MYSLLLVIIYLAFISLGLPDSLLGSAWPVMNGSLGVPMSYAGIISMIISAGTVISGLSSDRLTRRFGAGWVTAVSVLLTAVALFGFSVSGSFWLLCALAVPYGLGAGAIDAALNNYVALHYASRHMSWLHCFWGIGTMVSPYIMGACLTRGLGWHSGYRIVSFLQIGLTILLFCSLPLWKKRQSQEKENGKEAEDSGRALRLRDAVQISGVKMVLIVFFAYCAMESTTGLWASSYLVAWRHVGAETAARFASLFYIGITFGRFVSGFVSERLGDRRLIRLGGVVVLFGIAMVALPTASCVPALAGLVIIGLGCAPVYPSIIHATPANFGKDNSQAIIGIQMASAYVGTTFMPPVFGLIAQHVSIALYPAFLLVFAILMLVMSERMNRRLDKAAAEKKA
ncbi:MAG: MFS transporter [Lachnospiraceae bacterium]|nr:MFS transporter [Lachnospiraceae bacterium]